MITAIDGMIIDVMIDGIDGMIIDVTIDGMIAGMIDVAPVRAVSDDVHHREILIVDPLVEDDAVEADLHDVDEVGMYRTRQAARNERLTRMLCRSRSPRRY